MAVALNKNRMLFSKLAIVTTVLVVLLSREYWPEESTYHELFDIAGGLLVGLCAIGRVYSTAFLGGFKNEILVDYGIYSVLRNPLYFFSLIGITGVALMSNHISVMIGLPLFFFIMYQGLITREQEFLKDKFGENYLAYARNTRALIPCFANYQAPATMEINPRYLTKALLDAVWWLTALPIIEFVEYLQTKNIVPVFFVG